MQKRVILNIIRSRMGTNMQTATKETSSLTEPVEDYLRRVLCVDKLALYQPIIDSIKQAELFDIMDTINNVVAIVNDDDAASKYDQINDVFLTSLRQMLAQFDVIVDSDDLRFMSQLFDILQILDVYDDHQTIINMCLMSGTPIDKLYSLVTLIDHMDEEQFFSSVKMVSLSLIEKIYQLHDNALETIEEIQFEDIDQEKIDLFRRIAEKHPRLIAVELVRDHQLKPNMRVQAITNIVTHRFAEYETTHNEMRHLALELIACFVLSDIPMSELLTVIKSQYQYLINDDTTVIHVNAVISGVLTEVMAYGQT